jgi:hypothetical protein
MGNLLPCGKNAALHNSPTLDPGFILGQTLTFLWYPASGGFRNSSFFQRLQAAWGFLLDSSRVAFHREAIQAARMPLPPSFISPLRTRSMVGHGSGRTFRRGSPRGVSLGRGLLIAISLFGLVGSGLVGCKRAGESSALSREQAGSLARARAEGLHYPVDQMEVLITESKDQFFVRLAAPPDRPGMDVSFRIDKETGKIVEVIQGPERPAHPVDGREAIEIAKRKAVELGYPVATMEVSVERSDTEFQIVFWPPLFTLGGDVTVWVDSRTGEVTRVERGQ